MEDPMRSRCEIMRAHDLLLKLLLHAELDEINQLIVSCNADVLCWVLRHDSNTTFGKTLSAIDAVLAKVRAEA